MRRWHLLLVLVSLCSLQPASADVLQMPNGDRLTGTVNSIQDGTLIFDAVYAGRVIVPLSAVAQLETERAVAIRLASGDTLNGRLVMVEDSQAVQTSRDVTPIALRDIQRMAMNQINPVDLGSGWRNLVDLSVSISTGNTEIEDARVRAESLLRRQDREHVFTLSGHYQETNNAPTRNQAQVNYDYRWFYRDDWFLVGNGEFFHDQIRGIQERFSLSGGIGHRFWEDTLGKLSAEVSLGATYENRIDDRETNPALRWAMDYNRFVLAKQIELFHRNRILQIFERDRGTLFTATTGVRYALNERWSATVHVELQHETQPQEGREKTDVTYALGVGIRF
jgi:putative salt-induced outer membrane protein YdiY